jgi:membrane protein implicated in regulation of membrane protease activity
MSTVFLYCAAIGGTLLVVQFVLLLFGAGADTDIGDHHAVGHDQGTFLKLFSVQTLTTFATFFGLIGLATEGLGWAAPTVAVAATLAGVAALWLVARLMRSLSRLQSQGNVDLDNAIGQSGTVYLRVPAAGQGHGRVFVQVQSRSVECRAISHGAEIPTGSAIRVIACTDDEVLVVEPAV